MLDHSAWKDKFNSFGFFLSKPYSYFLSLSLNQIQTVPKGFKTHLEAIKPGLESQKFKTWFSK